MPYVFQISFDVASEDFHELRMGESVQTALGYMHALLPNEPGYVTSRGMFSLSREQAVHVVFQSYWEDWDSMLQHRDHSRLNEQQLLNEFELRVKLHNLRTDVFEEIG